MKKKNKKYLIFLAFITFLLFFIWKTIFLNKKKHLFDLPELNNEKINLIKLEERNIFFEAIAKFPKEKKSNSNYSACISPHHLFAADLIAESLSIGLTNQPKTIILVGPNHFNLGNNKMFSSDYSWETDIGLINPDTKIIHELKKNNFIELNNEILKNDHAIFNLIPFIKHYSPNSKIVPILFNNEVNLQDIENLTNFLIEKLSPNDIILSSIDFSHYLTAEIASKKDKKTIALIKENSFEEIFNLNDDYLDCPSCLVLSILFSNKKNAKKIKIIQNTNSGFLTKNYNSGTTSYITAIFKINN